MKIIIDGLNLRAIDYKILLMPDHATPVVLRTHTIDEIPYIIFDSTKMPTHSALSYSETEAAKTGLVVENGYDIMGTFLQ